MKRPLNGFATMYPAVHRAFCVKGGRAAHALGHAHEYAAEEAREAGRKGGRSVSRIPGYMVEIGRRGGLARAWREKRVVTRAGTSDIVAPDAAEIAALVRERRRALWRLEFSDVPYPQRGTGALIRAARLARGVCQARLARACGMDATLLCRYELGRREPVAEVVRRCLSALNVTVQQSLLWMASGNSERVHNPLDGAALTAVVRAAASRR